MFKQPLANFSSEEAKRFYETYRNHRLSDLLLKFGHETDEREWALQLDARKKALHKIPTWFNTSGIVLPLSQYLEQASSEATAQYKAELMPYETSLDLTGGTGIDSWQIALRAKRHIYVEPNDALARLAAHNFNLLGLTNVTFANTTAEEFLTNISIPIDLIFIDPSRRLAGKRVVQLENYSPNVPVLLPDLLKKAKNVLVKVSPLADIHHLTQLFGEHLVAIHVVAVNNECKEILVHCAPTGQANPTIYAVNLSSGTTQVFSFSTSDENHKAMLADQPQIFLFEPNAAVLKSGGFNALANQFKLQKLHPNSHLYTAETIISDFPGRTFKIDEVCKPYKMSTAYQPVNVATRNFPEKAEAIQAKLRLKQGSDFRLFATTIKSGKAFIIGKEVVA